MAGKKPKHVYLIAAARKVWYWSQERRAAIAAASVGPDMVRCAHCRRLFPKNGKKGSRKLYAVDHIEPVVPVGKSSPQIPVTTGAISWDEWLERLMCGALQVLCNPCHSIKSKRENHERKQKKQKLPALRSRSRN
jgi:hypothetical protein